MKGFFCKFPKNNILNQLNNENQNYHFNSSHYFKLSVWTKISKGGD